MTTTCGVDWSEAQHDVAIVADQSSVVARARVSDDAAGFSQLLELLAEHGDGESIPIAIETDKGLFVAALTAAGFTLFAINPRAAARYRERHGQAGGKSDLLTELPSRCGGRDVRGPAGLARFRRRDQRWGCPAGAVRVGGAASRVA